MVKVRDDLTGMTFSRLTVIQQAEDYVTPMGTHVARWLCKCSCGSLNPIIVEGSKLKNGHTKSCGCLQREMTSVAHKEYNTYSDELTDEFGKYYIGRTNNTNKEFYVDAEDLKEVQKYCWYEHVNVKTGYHSLEACDINTGKHIKMHYLIVGKYCDHKDRNPLNNRRFNLRQATLSENTQNRSRQKNNTSGVTGVYWDKSRNKWYAVININKKPVNLGRFSNKEDAIITRLNAEYEYYGEFAPQKHLFKDYKIL